MKRTQLLICAAMCAAAAVSCGNKDKGDGLNHLYDAPLLGNPASLDPQYANDASSNTVIKNMYSGLMQSDEKGSISCCNAANYEISSDGMTYRFTLRKDNYWFADKNGNDIIEKSEYFPVTADDYVFAFQRLLDPKMQSPYAKLYSCIKGGEKIIAGELSPASAGVRAIDDYTLEICLDYPSAEFLSLLAATPASPCNKEFFDSTKGTYGLDDKSVMCNGAFYMRQWFYDPYGNHNILYMGRCDINTNMDRKVLPSLLSFTIEKTEDDVREKFKDDQIECLTTLSSSFSSKKYNIEGTSGITLGLIFNQKEGYFSSESLRMALAYSINREELADELSDDLQAAYGIVPPAAVIAGRSYREVSADKAFDMYAPDEAVKLIEKAKEELKVGSFNSVKILVCADTVDSEYLHLLSQSWQDDLGIYIGIEDVTPEEFYERIDSGNFGLALYPLKGNMASPVSVISRFEEDERLKSASDGKEHSSEIMRAATVSEELEKCTAAEREILKKCCFIPVFYKNSYIVSHSDNEDIFYDPFTGAVDYRSAKNYS